jgi:tetratricopeptide (TPR) repeat protein
VTQIENQKIQTTNPAPPISTAQVDCAIEKFMDMPIPDKVAALIREGKAKLDQQTYECAIQALEQAGSQIRAMQNHDDRAAEGIEIKEVVLDTIRTNKLPDVSLEMRAAKAAVQSLDANGNLDKSASEDERLNDAGFYSQLANIKCPGKGQLILGSACPSKEIIVKMFELDFSLPPARRYVESWRYDQYLQNLNMLEIANLWKIAPTDASEVFERGLASLLGTPLHGYVLIGIELMSSEKAKNEVAGLDILQPAVERIRTKQGDLWIWPVYRYAAEAYWQTGEKEKAKTMLGRARESIKTAKSAPAGRVNAYMDLATSMCKLIRSNGKVVQMCPIGIYDTKALSAMFDEFEEMAKAASNTYALGRVEVLRKRLAPGG